MVAFSELTGKEKAIELLRWICVLPAAMLAYVAVGFVISSAPNTHWVLLICYMPKEIAFVVAGAKTAPRSRTIATLVLAAVAILASLAIHVLTQQRVGLTNYLHFGAESVGAVIGAIYIVYAEIKANRQDMTGVLAGDANASDEGLPMTHELSAEKPADE